MANNSDYRLYRKGDNVAELLNKIERLGPATGSEDGLMTKEDKQKLDSADFSTFINKAVDDLVNYYLKSEVYTKDEVNSIVSAYQLKPVVAQSLPTASAETMYKMYLVPSPNADTGNAKDEFITIDNGTEADPRYTWEQIGSTAISLDGVVMYSESQTLTDAQKLQARTNIGAAAPEVFWAEYGVTTRAEVISAAQAGKLVCVYYNNSVFVGGALNTTEGSTANFYFGCVENGALKSVYLGSNGTWGGPIGFTTENPSNKKTSVSANASSDTYYPTTKAVADYAQPIIDSSHKLDYSLLNNTPTIPSVPTISTDISADATSDTKTASPKAVKTFVEGKGYGTYSKPSGGIPASDLSSDIKLPFVVVWGTSSQTTLTEMLVAVAAGRPVFCHEWGEIDPDNYMPLANIAYSNGSVSVVTFKSVTRWATYTVSSGDWDRGNNATPVNADWNASSGLAQILNKPTIPVVEALTDSEIDTIWNAN